MNSNNIEFEIEKLVLINSLYKNFSLNQLADTYKSLIILRNLFLSSTFSGTSLKEAEELRYRIIENILKISEKVGLNCEIEKKEQ